MLNTTQHNKKIEITVWWASSSGSAASTLLAPPWPRPHQRLGIAVVVQRIIWAHRIFCELTAANERCEPISNNEADHTEEAEKGDSYVKCFFQLKLHCAQAKAKVSSVISPKERSPFIVIKIEQVMRPFFSTTPMPRKSHHGPRISMRPRR